MLFEETFLGKVDKVQKAIDRLKSFEPKDGSGFYLAFSGGKDSQCIYHLAKMAGVKFDAHYSVTSIDPPELMKFIKANYPDVIWDYPVGEDGKPTSMWKIISEHTIPPTRRNRYCCDILKEQHGEGRVTVTGVRWAESIRRRDSHGVVDVRTSSKKIINDQLENNPSAKLNNHGSLIFMDDNEESRRMVEHCFRKKRTTVNPIIDWTEEDVWQFLDEVAEVPHCCLYDDGFTRLGCIGCPLQGREGMLREFERWPRYKELYIRAFDKMIQNHPGEIRVASGDPVPEIGGGVLRYTQDGSAGTPDGETSFQQTEQSGASEQNRTEQNGGSGQRSRTSTSGSATVDRQTDRQTMEPRLATDGQSGSLELVPRRLTEASTEIQESRISDQEKMSSGLTQDPVNTPTSERERERVTEKVFLWWINLEANEE